MKEYLSNNQIYWFVMRAYKSEAKAEEKLSEQGLDYFIPKHFTIQKYHGKFIKRLVPVIPSLLFVHATYAQILEFKIKFNFLQFAMWKKSTGMEHIIVRDDQMENFIKVASQYNENLTYYKYDEINLKRGTRVRIIGGAFDGVEGVFIKKRNSKKGFIVVILDGFCGISAEVNPDIIQVLS